MLPAALVVLASLAYLGLLFALAWWGDRRAERGRSLIANPYVYALSLAVYCTAWTFYGSVGRAATDGVGFLPIYLGPTLVAVMWTLVVRKMVRIARRQRITSIADFIAARYGKRQGLAALAAGIAVVGIIPYIALQLKAISTSFQVLTGTSPAAPAAAAPVAADTAFYVTLLLAAFTILFGTRHLDAAERHEGLVLAVAVESGVKLAAFLAVGLFVTFGLFGGPADLFARAAADPDLAGLFTMDALPGGYAAWLGLTVLSMAAILLLPRQFQVAVVENVDEAHLAKATWLFPLYLFLINLFVLPIALGGALFFAGQDVHADTYVLTLPLAAGQDALALFVFLGGLSAATAMVIVATVALATMISNDLVVPLLLRRGPAGSRLPSLVLGVRRGAIVAVLLLGYAYVRGIGEAYSLVSIGLISFAAVAQFAPALLGGMYWKRATHAGAVAGLLGGFLVWVYTLPLPSLVDAGVVPASFVEAGPAGIAALRPYALLGLEDFDPVTHSLFWSALVNVGLFVGVSLFTRQRPIEVAQAAAFVDVFRQPGPGAGPLFRRSATVHDLEMLLARFLGRRRAREVLAAYARAADPGGDGLPGRLPEEAPPDLVDHVERALAGVLGSASARVVVATVVEEEPLTLREVLHVLDEARRAVAHSQVLEAQRAALERAARDLQRANEDLRELDRLKDRFVETVTHELKTPLTSIRALSEIMHANPDLGPEQRAAFLGIVIQESERLTRLINQVLDLQKLEAGAASGPMEPLDLRDVVADAVAALRPQASDDTVALETHLPETPCTVQGDRDRLVQLVLNLLSNALKFARAAAAERRRPGRVTVHLHAEDGRVRLAVADDGPGIHPDDLDTLFDRFRQARHGPRLGGTGLGLTIARHIATAHRGTLTADSTWGSGATFTFEMPAALAEPHAAHPDR